MAQVGDLEWIVVTVVIKVGVIVAVFRAMHNKEPGVREPQELKLVRVVN